MGESGGLHAPLDVELTREGSMLANLNEEADPQLTAYFEPLQAAAESMRDALNARRAAIDAQVNAFGLPRAESIRWMDVYRRSYRDLRRRFYRDGDYAESFFRSPVVNRSAGQGEVAAGTGGVAVEFAAGAVGSGGGTAERAGAPSVNPGASAVRLAAAAVEVAEAA